MARWYVCRVGDREVRVEGLRAAKCHVERLMRTCDCAFGCDCNFGRVDGGLGHLWSAARQPTGVIKWERVLSS